MTIRGSLARLLQPSESVEDAAARWAERYFPVDQRGIAREVAFCIAETLCVPVFHFTPDTDLVSGLAADETWEWKMMALHLGARLQAEVSLDPDIVGRRPRDIVGFLIANPPLPKVRKPRWWKKVGRRKAAEPGATDNPDDAQRLREDH